jgi:hypothetical protein
MEAEAQIYCRLMAEAKQRLGLVRQLDQGEFSTTRTEFDIELACLNLRRVLELVAFASLAANRAAYSRYHADFHTHWKAAKILSKLESIHPAFFPVPMSQPGTHMAMVEKRCLTRSDFAELYDITSEVLHAWNPFKSARHHVNMVRSPRAWAELIWELLSVHMLTVAESDKRFIVQMHHPEDEQVHVYVAQPLQA